MIQRIIGIFLAILFMPIPMYVVVILAYSVDSLDFLSPIAVYLEPFIMCIGLVLVYSIYKIPYLFWKKDSNKNSNENKCDYIITVDKTRISKKSDEK
ncbi:MAG: hypothetical protein R3Y63_13555 [Eubacteriales bacterium]